MRRAAAWVVAALVAVGLTAAGAPAGAQAAIPDDPGFDRQWGIDAVGAPAAWPVATGVGMTIAIVDSGIDATHPELRDRVEGLADCVGHDDLPSGCLDGAGVDESGHGTHVAGIAAAATDNGQGVAGVAPGANLLAVRVLDCPDDTPGACDPEGTERDVSEGVRWAADHGADVINLSLGNVASAVIGPGSDLVDALEYAWSRGAVPVLVSGNGLLPGSLVDVPAVVVAATDRDGQAASYSNGVGNVRWAVAAPGGEADTRESCEDEPQGILSTYYGARQPGGASESIYACLSGTSMAAPHVSGAIAVLRSAGLGPTEAVDRLLASARDVGPTGRDNEYGSGIVDLARAVEGLSSTPPATDTTAVTAPVTTEPAPTVPATSVTPAPVEPLPTAPAAPTTEGPTVGTPVGEATPVSAAGEDEDLPVAPLSVAVLLVVAVIGLHGWRYLQQAPWAQRTPQ